MLKELAKGIRLNRTKKNKKTLLRKSPISFATLRLTESIILGLLYRA